MFFHGLSPPLSGGIEGFDKRTLLKVLLVGFCGAELSGTGIRSLANGIVQIELSGEVPLVIICVLTADVVHMEGEECLVWGHTGRSRAEKLHGEIKLIGVVR